jgi:hypothetical protein
MTLQESGTMSLIRGVGLISIVKMLTDADNCGKLNMAKFHVHESNLLWYVICLFLLQVFQLSII